MSTIHLQCGKKRLESNLEAKVQSVPFNIHADCDAKVAQYFDRYVKSNADYSKVSFRGYPLMGKKITVPEGYRGLVLHESMRPAVQKEVRNLHVLHTFENITLWNWDKIPDNNDALTQALDWIEIAERLHSPIIEE